MKLASKTLWSASALIGLGGLSISAATSGPVGDTGSSPLPAGDTAEQPLADEVRLGAPRALLLLSGEPVDVIEGAGHAGPLVMDLDGEAPNDLLVGDLRGSLQMYLGRKTEDGIRYESKGPLQSSGEDIRVHNW